MRDDVLSLACIAFEGEESEGFFGDFVAWSSLSVMVCMSTISFAC